MSGKPPITNLHIVTRDFRGSRLYLQTRHRGARYWRWTDDERTALPLDQAAALDASETASREYGAKCAVLNANGTFSKRAGQDSHRTLTVGTRAVVRFAHNHYVVVCATCGAGGNRRFHDQDMAGKVAVRDSARGCAACGAS